MIRTEKLTKKFGKLKAIDNINVKIDKGEVFGLLGPNGAGKTTLISVLTTLLKPTSGKAKVDGKDIRENPEKIRNDIGIIFQENICDSYLTVYENLDISARLYLVRNKEKRIEELLDLLNLKKEKNKKLENLSGGTKRKVEIARGLINNPKIIFMDEPTSGLDPRMRRKIWEYINKLKDSTIILATHYLTEAEELCDRVGIMNKGKVVKIGKPDNLKKILKKNKIDKNITLYDVFLEHTK